MINNEYNLNWQPCTHASLPLILRPWILNPDSFIEHLIAQGVKHPQIKVLSEIWLQPYYAEKTILQLNDTNALIREVLIYSETNIWMFARTIFPRETIVGKYQELANLRNRSLGSILFNDPCIRRGKFMFAKIDKTNPWHHKIAKQVDVNESDLWARQSIFYLEEKKLLLTEVFLPALMELSCPLS